MFKHGLRIRTFATTALRNAEASTAYNTKVSTAQGWVNGLTEGTRTRSPSSIRYRGSSGVFLTLKQQLAIRR